MRRLILAALLLCVGHLSADGQFLNSAHLSGGKIAVPESVFDNSGVPWPFLNSTGAENYDLGGNGVAFSIWQNPGCGDTAGQYRSDSVNFYTPSDGTFAYRVGCIKLGDYLKYTVNISVAGPFTISIRAATSETGGAWAAYVDNILIGTLDVPNTGGSGTFTTVTSPSFNATTGNHTVKLQVSAVGASGFGPDLASFQGTQVGAVPAVAAAAGFNQLIINDDFTSPAFANPATWLDCAGASSPLYWRAWDGFGPYPDCPISIVSDQGSNSVRIHWQDSYLGFLPGNNSPMQTTPDNAPGRATPPGFYLEVVSRTDNSGAGIHPWLANWSYSVHQGGTGAYEIDGFEEFQNGGGGGFAIHNFGAAASDQNCAGQYCGCADVANACAGAFLDVTQYHKYAWRQTSAGTDIIFCTYIDDRPYGCGSIKPNSFQLNDALGMVHQFSIGTTGTAGSAVGNGNGKNNLIKSIKAWSCAGLNSGQLCRSSSNNP